MTEKLKVGDIVEFKPNLKIGKITRYEFPYEVISVVQLGPSEEDGFKVDLKEISTGNTHLLDGFFAYRFQRFTLDEVNLEKFA